MAHLHHKQFSNSPDGYRPPDVPKYAWDGAFDALDELWKRISFDQFHDLQESVARLVVKEKAKTSRRLRKHRKTS